MDERRRRMPRQIAGWAGRYRFNGAAEADWAPCTVLDISFIGAAIEVAGTLANEVVGQVVGVEVDTPAGGAMRLSLHGVCRAVSAGPTGGTRIGFEFTELSETEVSILDALSHMQVFW